MQTCGMPKGFDSAAYSDAFWERLLRSDYRELIARAVSPLDFGSKNKLYFSLSYTHILLDRGYLIWRVVKSAICWVQRSWEWEHAPESRFPEVCILKRLHWLSIHGKIASVMLSPNSTYKAYLVFRTSTNSKGLSVTAKTTVSFGGLAMSFQLDKESGKKCYMLGAKELSITWQHDTQYWEWTHIPESRFPEVCILKQVYWLSIHGRIVAGMLSQNNTYDAYLVFGTTKDSRGVSVPAKTRLSFGGSEMETENVYLQRPHRVQENYVFPHKRKDGWMEIKLGEFDYNEGDNGKVEMAYEEIKLGHWKKGLIVEGIELRPK
uniref:Uncharacterized protein n=1 Tax=Lactuca sativa TaxID=4236 RepID=A0A9R1W9V5_LACSA|nr:hypothetical protein LSAT_V11C200065800 [Lactuca sativa]